MAMAMAANARLVQFAVRTYGLAGRRGCGLILNQKAADRAAGHACQSVDGPWQQRHRERSRGQVVKPKTKNQNAGRKAKRAES
jgi:hypothetical protein